MKAKYAKPFLGVRDQVQLLEQRGLDIDVPRAEAEAFLETVNYYRFTGYAIPFLVNREKFHRGTKFSLIRDVYSFDRRLRHFLFDALEAVELTFRTFLAREIGCRYGPLGYLDTSIVNDFTEHAGFIGRVGAEFGRSDEQCSRHFRDRYFAPPVWSVVETASFGTLVCFYRNLHIQDQNAVSTKYGMRGDFLASYMQHAGVLRNLCAHHARIYDRRYSYLFNPLPQWKKAGGVNTGKLFYQCALAYRLLMPTAPVVFDRDHWKRELSTHLATLPRSPVRDLFLLTAVPKAPFASPLW